jgi:DNA-binding MurR/RpiR family transcriptional regulator
MNPATAYTLGVLHAAAALAYLAGAATVILTLVLAAALARRAHVALHVRRASRRAWRNHRRSGRTTP